MTRYRIEVAREIDGRVVKCEPVEADSLDLHRRLGIEIDAGGDVVAILVTRLEPM